MTSSDPHKLPAGSAYLPTNNAFARPEWPDAEDLFWDGCLSWRGEAWEKARVGGLWYSRTLLEKFRALEAV